MDPAPELLLDQLARGQRLGYLGTGDLRAHIEHARAHCRAAHPQPGQRWCDLGSGGGVPGLVIALDRPDVEFVLLDRSERRAQFLEDAVRCLGISNRVRIAEGDAAQLAHRPEHRHAYDGAVSRAFGPPAAVAECSSGLVRPGGRLVVSEPPHLTTRGWLARWPVGGLAELGWDFDGLSDGEPTFAVLTRQPSHSDIYPRAWKRIRKRPIF